MMPHESTELKAKKLASARQKLKEYQTKEKRESNEGEDKQHQGNEEHFISCNHDTLEINDKPDDIESKTSNILPSSFMIQNELNKTNNSKNTEEKVDSQNLLSSLKYHNSPNSLEIIQLLVTEKAALSTELEKIRIICKEKDLENEEMKTQLTTINKRLKDLQTQFIETQKLSNESSNKNINLQNDFEKIKKDFDEKNDHLEELKKKLTIERTLNQEIEKRLHDKCNEMELAQIRINQLSNKNTFSNDDHTEALTQSKFMYEQQIRDLQAIVQQLSHDKEQANQQYQSYVQHLNSEILSSSQKYTELSDECSKLREQEQQLIDHISGLEREIQKSIARKETFNSDLSKCNSKKENELKEKISELENEILTLQLRMKSQEENFEKQNIEIIRKKKEMEKMHSIIQNYTSEQPDKTKLLASIESDKLAASRALSQNEDLKNQLDVLQLRIVELTNDKAELINCLDSKEYQRKEIQSNLSELQKKIHIIYEKLHFKDEEMIRLSHENNDLTKKNLELQKQLEQIHHHDSFKHLEHYKKPENYNNCEVENFYKNSTENFDDDESQAAPNNIKVTEAIEKLQYRFTNLISEVANLTDEKQRLEHLVLQLQSETETIGEYIALYQTQRRILKQRENEKAVQMQLLQIEKEKMREKIVLLSNLVSSLGNTEIPGDKNEFNNNLNKDLPESRLEFSSLDNQVDIEEIAIDKKLGSNESQIILSKIQNIIKEIKENTKEITPKYNADYLNCCLGKFEIV